MRTVAALVIVSSLAVVTTARGSPCSQRNVLRLEPREVSDLAARVGLTWQPALQRWYACGEPMPRGTALDSFQLIAEGIPAPTTRVALIRNRSELCWEETLTSLTHFAMGRNGDVALFMVSDRVDVALQVVNANGAALHSYRWTNSVPLEWDRLGPIWQESWSFSGNGRWFAVTRTPRGPDGQRQAQRITVFDREGGEPWEVTVTDVGLGFAEPNGDSEIRFQARPLMDDGGMGGIEIDDIGAPPPFGSSRVLNLSSHELRIE